MDHAFVVPAAASVVSQKKLGLSSSFSSLRRAPPSALSSTRRFFQGQRDAERRIRASASQTGIRMSKIVSFDEHSQEALRRGVEAVANAVALTMGPKGRNVVLQNKFGAPYIVNDGVTIAQQVELENPEENAGVRLVQEIASRTNDVAGDGTTTATVLAREIVNEGLRLVAAGANPIGIKRGIDKTCQFVREEVTKVATRIADDEFEKVATISASDPEIGKIIGDAMKQVGRTGVITLESSQSTETVVEVEEGMEIDRGYISAQFINNQSRSLVEFEDAKILLTDLKIKSVADIVPILEKVTQAGKPLLIIADDVSGEALQTLVLNKIAGVLNVAAIRAPSFADRRRQNLEDIAILTGGRAFIEDQGVKLETAKMEDLGTARKVFVYQGKTVLVSNSANPEELQSRVKQLQKDLAEADTYYDKEKLTERINKLAGGLAVIKVGAMTETEMESNKLRFEDAVNATKAAVEEGVIPGGGTCLVKLVPRVEEYKASLADEDERMGADVVIKAMLAPLRQIAHNAGEEGDVIVAKVRDLPFSVGYNASTGKIEDMMEAGVLDPAKVTRSALENACSVGALVLTTKALVTSIPVKEVKQREYEEGEIAV
eukprot:tig00001107_g7104.t1